MPQERTTSFTRRRAAGAVAAALVLTGSLAACGSSDDSSSTTAAQAGATTSSTTGGAATTTGGTATTANGAPATTTSGAATPNGGAPAADEGAIRAALARSAASSKAAKTARISIAQSTAGIQTRSTGTVDLVDQRALIDETVGGAGKALKVQSYVEKGKVYVKTPFAKGWSVTASPIQSSDPLAQVRELAKAQIVKVGGTSTYDGHTCRNFDAKVALADALGAVKDPTLKGLLKDAPKGATIPISSCIDDAGLSYASQSSYALKDVLGSSVGASLPKLAGGRSTSTIRVTDYGSAPAPARPSGIDDAKPLGSTSSGLSGAAG